MPNIPIYKYIHKVSYFKAIVKRFLAKNPKFM
jgi:hypothetical protein